MTAKLMLYLSYPFVRYALVTGVLISLCASLLGVTLVLRHFSYIGDGLSHAAFGAAAAAAVLGLADQRILVLPVTVVTAVLLLNTGRSAHVRGDAAIAMISTGALALGYLLMNIFATSPNLSGDVCSALFGSASILTLTGGEVTLSIVLSVLVAAFFIMFHNQIFAVTFDENFARASGTNTRLCNLILAVITAVIIVLAMDLVGSLLISSLIVFPPLAALRLFKSFRSVTVCSACISVICAAFGMIISISAGTPAGATIAAADIAAYFAVCLYVTVRQ